MTRLQDQISGFFPQKIKARAKLLDPLISLFVTKIILPPFPLLLVSLVV